MRDLMAGDELVVLTWLDRARRDLLWVHPLRRPFGSQQGCVQHPVCRPSEPIGTNRTTVEAVEAERILVSQLEAVAGTPIVDVQPVI